jgi:hypothetical protein
MKAKLSVFLLSILILSFGTVTAQDYAVGLKLSTLGISVEGTRSFGEKLNARLGLSYFSYTYEGDASEEDDYSYAGDLNLFSVSALADYFPFGGIFRLTGGLMINLNAIDGTLTPNKTYTVGGDQYTPEKLGDLNAEIDFNAVAPYLGIGLGNSLAAGPGVKFTFDIGTVYQGSPGVNLSADGLIAPSASSDQEKTLEDNLNWFQWYPVLSVGIIYKF